jgi:hypothetical protein
MCIYLASTPMQLPIVGALRDIVHAWILQAGRSVNHESGFANSRCDEAIETG